MQGRIESNVLRDRSNVITVLPTSVVKAASHSMTRIAPVYYLMVLICVIVEHYYLFILILCGYTLWFRMSLHGLQYKWVGWRSQEGAHRVECDSRPIERYHCSSDFSREGCFSFECSYHRYPVDSIRVFTHIKFIKIILIVFFRNSLLFHSIYNLHFQYYLKKIYFINLF